MTLKLKLRYIIPIFLAILTMIITIIVTPAYSSYSFSAETISDDGTTINEYHEIGSMEQIRSFSQILLGALVVSCFVGVMSYLIIILLIYVLNLIKLNI